MVRLLCVTAVLLLPFSILSIHVPGENVNKQTLTTLGIKTIDWQDNEGKNSAQINIHHNYSRVYVQNGEIGDGFSQYTQSSGGYGNDFGQQTEFQTTGESSSNVFQHQQTLTNEENQERYKFSDNQQIYNVYGSGGGSTTLQFDQIMEAENRKRQENVEDSSAFDGPTDGEQRQRTAKNFYTLDKPIYVHGFKYPPDPKDVYPLNEYQPKLVPEPYTKCPKMATGQFVYALSCNQFLNCWKGRGYVQNCAPGTLFNPETLECDFASKVHCVTGPRKPEYGDETPSHLNLATGCPVGFSGVVPHHTDCSKFINCDNGAEHVMDCPPGTLFSLKINNCNHPYETECAHWSINFGNVRTDQTQTTDGSWSGHDLSGSHKQYVHGNSQDRQQNYGQTQIGGQWTASGTHHGSNSQNHDTYDGSKQIDRFQDQNQAGTGWNWQQHQTRYGQGQIRVDGGRQNQAGWNSYQETRYDGDSDTGKCPSGFTGLQPHPTVCSKFLSCTNGHTMVQDCGPGTVFDPKSKVCDFAYKVDCARTKNSGSTVQGEDLIVGSHTQYVHGAYYHQGGSETTTTTQTGGYGLNKIEGEAKLGGSSQKSTRDGIVRCPDGGSGLYPHPSICSKFLNCANGITYVQDCGPGTVFNPVSKVCDFPYNVDCGTHHGEGMIDARTVPIHRTQQQTQTGHVQNRNVPVPQQQNWQNHGTNRFYATSGTRTQSESYGQTATGDQDTEETRHFQGSASQAHNTIDYPFVPSSFASTDGSTTTVSSLPTEPNPSSRTSCEPTDFRCAPNDCVLHTSVCDGIQDCPNGIDEHRCDEFLQKFTYHANSILGVRDKQRYFNVSIAYCAKTCLETDRFQCKSFSYRKAHGDCFLSDANIGGSGALISAVPYSYFEVTASTVDCRDLYKCPNNKCVQFKRVCDGVNDCGDRTDEKGCASKAFGYEIKLGGTDKKHEGRIELKAFGKQGYVCDDKFGKRNADVACRELGFPLGAIEVKGNSYYAQDLNEKDVFYLMDDVTCLGNETSLKDCDFNGWGVHNCEPQEVVGVLCKTPVENCPKDQWKCDSVQECVPLAFVCDDVFDCSDQSDEASQHCEAPTELRLVNGKSRHEGRVEIRHHGIWGTVCDDDFNDDAAKVVCKSLGHPGSAVATKDGYFGPGTGPIWLDQVYCQGNESSLTQCVHWNWGEHNCEHSEDVGVICSDNYDNFVEADIEVNERHNIIEALPEHIIPDRCGLRKDDQFMEDDSIHYRVIKGSVAKRGDYPWQASLRIKTKSKSSHWCGAVVISSKFVLTAAHCLVGFAKGAYFVSAGDYDTDDTEGTEQEAYIEEFYVHERFRTGQKMNNDIALVKLKGDGFILTKDVQPICLPDALLEYETGLNCTISGFGTEQSGKAGYSHSMRAGWVPLQSKEVCQMPHVYGNAITDGMICAGSLDEGVDACEGDSGGPLACLSDGLFTLYGITSWGKHCGHANKPGVYVKVSYYRDWIDETIKKNVVL